MIIEEQYVAMTCSSEACNLFFDAYFWKKRDDISTHVNVSTNMQENYIMFQFTKPIIQYWKLK